MGESLATSATAAAPAGPGDLPFAPRQPQRRQGSGDILLTGVRRVLGRPRLIALLWLPSLLLAMCASLPVYLGLAGVLAYQPLAQALVRGDAPDVLWGELLRDHRAGLLLALSGLAVAALLYWLLATLLTGGLLQALRRPGDPRRAVGPRVLEQAAAQAPRMFGLACYGLLLRLPVVVLVLVFFAKIQHGFLRADYRLVLAGGGVTLLSLLFLWSATSVVLHYAQLHLIGDGPAGRAGRTGLRALRRGFGLAFARGTRGTTALLALASVVALVVLVVLGRVLAHRLDLAMAVTLGVLLRQLCSIARAAVGLSVMAAAVEVMAEATAEASQSGSAGPIQPE